MICRKLTLLVVTAFAWNSALAQFQDASNRDEAVGMMLSTEISNKYFMEKCSASFPDLSSEMARNESAWKNKEVLAVSNYRVRISDFESMNKTFVASFRSELLLAAKAQHQVLLGTPDKYRQYCQTHFSDLASGVWRRRTPLAYKFLEK